MLYEENLSERLSMKLDPNNNHSKSEKYQLRPRSMRHHDCDFEEVRKKPKPKQKSAPLSKYRRKTANARERTRMREINQAFETLRKAVPQLSENHAGNNEKLTKITTLRLAMKYISTLAACLTSDSDSNFEIDSNFFESDGDSADFCMDFEDPFAHFDPFLTEFS